MKRKEVISMKKVITILLCLLIAIAFISVSSAISEQKTESPQFEPKLQRAAKIQQITGVVKALNVIDKSIAVTKKMRKKSIEAVITIDDTTKIMKQDEKKTLSDLKVGDTVVAKYVKADGKNLAKSISIKQAEPTKKAEKESSE
jgi:ribosomal protein S1